MPRRRADADPLAPRVGVGGLEAVDDLHHLGLRGEALRLSGVVLGRCRRLDGPRLAVKKEIGRVQVLVALHARHGLRDEHLPRADDFGLQRQLLERRDEGGRLEDGRDGRAHVAGNVGRRLEEDLGGVILAATLSSQE